MTSRISSQRYFHLLKSRFDLEADLIFVIFITFILLKARDCYFTDESSLAFYDKYTFSNCRSKTKTKTMIKNEDI